MSAFSFLFLVFLGILILASISYWFLVDILGFLELFLSFPDYDLSKIVDIILKIMWSSGACALVVFLVHFWLEKRDDAILLKMHIERMRRESDAPIKKD